MIIIVEGVFMNQEKIGIFIAKLRKEKGMTQQELADKLGVTDKAISKWENGRCLMDIQLLQPLADCLDVSVIELLNGKKIENDNNEYTKEFIDKTLEIANIKLNEKIKKIIFFIILAITLLLLTILSIFCYKFIAAEHIYKNNYISFDDNYYRRVSEIDIVEDIEEITINTINIENYLSLAINNSKIKIRDDFEGMEKNKSGNRVSFKNDNAIFSISVYEGYSDYTFLINEFNKEEIIDYNILGNSLNFKGTIRTKDKEKILKKYQIKNDLDFLKHINNNALDYYYKNEFLNLSLKISEMKEIYAFNSSLLNGLMNLENIIKINGDNEGYIVSLKGNPINVNIVKDNKLYFFQLFTNNPEKYSIEWIKDLIATLVIE